MRQFLITVLTLGVVILCYPLPDYIHSYLKEFDVYSGQFSGVIVGIFMTYIYMTISKNIPEIKLKKSSKPVEEKSITYTYDQLIDFAYFILKSRLKHDYVVEYNNTKESEKKNYLMRMIKSLFKTNPPKK